MSEPHQTDHEASKMMRREIHAVITRYAKEATISYYQIIGCLAVIQADMIEEMEKRNTESGDGETE